MNTVYDELKSRDLIKQLPFEDEFIESIIKFKADTLPRIFEILEQYKNEKKITILKDYEQVNDFLHNLTNL